HDPEYRGDIRHAPKIDVRAQAMASQGDLDSRKLVHLLEFAHDRLPPEERALLSRIAAFRSPVSFETLSALSAAKPGKAAKRKEREALKAQLRALVDRGLLFAVEDGAAFDLHPAVRGHVYERLGDKKEMHARLRDHFAGVPPAEKVDRLE